MPATSGKGKRFLEKGKLSWVCKTWGHLGQGGLAENLGKDPPGGLPVDEDNVRVKVTGGGKSWGSVNLEGKLHEGVLERGGKI